MGGRAARRAQERAERRQRRQQGQATQRPTVPAPGPPVDSPQGGGSLLRPRWATDIISELRKVTWPTRRETAHLTTVVLIVSALFGLILGVADLGFSWFIEQTILR